MVIMEQQALRTAETGTSLPAVLSSESAARRFVESALLDWGLDDAVEDAVLITSELVANVLRHTADEPLLSLSRTGSRVLVEVQDSSPVMPLRKTGGALGGWGLLLVERLADDWGVRPLSRGKVVWCELDRTENPAA